MPQAQTSPQSQIDEALRQWPTIAGLGLLQLGALTLVFSTFVAPATIFLGQKLAIFLFILFFVAAECGVLLFLNVAIETATSRLGRSGFVDGAKALLLSSLLVLFTVSYLKLLTTGVHLRSTEAGFLVGSFRQLAKEAMRAELRFSLLIAALFAVSFFALFFTFQRLRRTARYTPPRRSLAILWLLSLVGAGYTFLAYPTANAFAKRLVPEIYWLRSAAPAQRFTERVGVDPMAKIQPGPAIGPPAKTPATRPENVIFIMLESIPWKRSPLAGWRLDAAPQLTELAKESVTFSRAYAMSTHSDYAQVGILSSLHPRKYEGHDFYRQIEYPRTLIWDSLQAAGYRTAMFSCQNEQWGNMLEYVKTPGLDLLRHSLDWPNARHRGNGLETKVYEDTPVDSWLEWLDGGIESPFFTYFNFQSNHFPYESPPDAVRPFTPYALDFPASFVRYPVDEAPVMLNRFANALYYTDSQIARIVAELKRRELWDRTALVVVSDHGEAFYEHGLPTHGSSLHEEQVRSFLLMRLPGEPARRIEQPTGLLDVTPTLLEYLGVSLRGAYQGRSDTLSRDYSAAGRPLFFTIQGMTAEDGVLLDDWKYVVNWDRRARLLYNLAVDPEENNNLVLTERARAESLHGVLVEFLGQQLAYYDRRAWESGHYIAPLP